ncbi:MAG: DedA family protein [Candidatus Taylorbacteria bacterium]|nr:DedA family protein [Candidatus Taylorbacteria bacterium]
MEQLIVNYGYLAIFIGAMIEGEVALVIAGFAAYLGYLSLPVVVLSGFLGSLLSDQLYFYFGRLKGRSFIESRPQLLKKAVWVHGVINKYHNWVLLFFRFAYGFRTVLPFTLGTGKVTAKRFVLYNIAGAALWSILFSLCGYFFGTALGAFISKVKNYEIQVVGLIIVIAVIIWVLVSIRKNEVLRMIKIDTNMII